MIESVLIANRGEIACRIQRTCRRMGIRTIAVYSDADRHARHVQQADDAVHIGPAEAVRSYLNADAIVDAALRSGAQAIHPGYGFLSEKVILPQRCAEHGLVWVGPRAEVIAMMGSKIESKHIAQAAGVTAVPGYHGEDQSADLLLQHAMEIGFPVLIKASAGGGGKGMRRVDDAARFLDQLGQAKHEAQRAFGDDRVLIEKLVTRPRHLEVQIAGDHHGNLVHLFERECSVQRNYQKMIEEAPAAYLPELVRERLFDQALRLGRQIGYDSLGTVEFVLDDGNDMPYFLEMNTRLQVEHPVTEHVVDMDLVELQLTIASGQPLPIQQKDVVVRGWAIEARINCEDPARDFQPQIGEVQHYFADELAGVRIDSGVQAGSVISPYYDSMIAKIIGSGLSRETALRRLSAGLAQFCVTGLGTNQALLGDILARPAFLDAPLTTRFMAEQFSQGWKVDAALERIAQCLGAWHMLFAAGTPDSAHSLPWSAASGFRTVSSMGSGAALVFVQTDRSDGVEVAVRRVVGGLAFTFADAVITLDIETSGTQRLRVRSDGQPMIVFDYADSASGLLLTSGGIRWVVSTRSLLQQMALAASEHVSGQGKSRSDMPGLITAVNVVVGQRVARGDVLLVMEAMKLIHSVEAEVAGIVSAVHCAQGDTVPAGMLLAEVQAQ